MSPDAYCAPCKSRGVTSIAHRIVARVPKCEACYREEREVLKPIGRDHPETQGKVLTNDMISERIAENDGVKEVAIVERKQINWTAVQNERSDGASVKELSKKHGVSEANVYLHTRRPCRRQAAPRAKNAPAPPTSGRFADVIAGLIAERDKLNEAIATLERLSGS